MTKRDFFILVIKLFGLMSILTSLFSVIPGNISFALTDIEAFSLIWIAFTILVVIGLFVILVFKADKIVGLLKLDKGFDDEKIELGSLNSSDIVKIGAFIIGGLLILDNIPGFLSHTYFAFKGSVSGQFYDTTDKFYLAVNGINIFLGYLLMTNYSFVERLLGTKSKENE
jgi:membrane-anchored glycerophosphoryl diester phosphodiesterase (GDPDase)